MTQEYEFFKDFAGVTKEDLEQLKCGGRMKKKQSGGELVKKRKTKTYQDYVNQFKPKKDAGQGFRDRLQISEINAEQKKQHDKQVAALENEKKTHPERFDSRGNRKYNKKDDEASLGGDQWNPKKKK